MAEETKPQAAAETAVVEKKSKKSTWPTNCAQSNKRIRRKDWYYRNGQYFANPQAFKLYQKQQAEKAAKEAAAQKEKEASAAAAPAAEPTQS